MAAPVRVPQRAGAYIFALFSLGMRALTIHSLSLSPLAVVTKVQPAPVPVPVAVQPQRIEIEEVRIPEQTLPPIGFGGQNRFDPKCVAYVEIDCSEQCP